MLHIYTTLPQSIVWEQRAHFMCIEDYSLRAHLVERLRDKYLGCFLYGLHRACCEAYVLVVLCNFPHQPLERPLGEEQVGGARQLPDLPLGNGAALPPACFWFLCVRPIRDSSVSYNNPGRFSPSLQLLDKLLLGLGRCLLEWDV